MTIASRLKQYLESHDTPYNLVKHTRSTTSSESAQKSHIPGDQLAKTVVIHHELGYVLAVVPSTCRVELGTLQEVVGKHLGLVTESEVAALFYDCEGGVVPPIGAAYGVSVILDESLENAKDVYFEGGDNVTLVHVSGTAFKALTKYARVARIGRGP